MQFVAPAQLLLVLWLLAATAPAATVLLNGSLVAFIDAQASEGSVRVRTETTDDDEPEPTDEDSTVRESTQDLPTTSSSSLPAIVWIEQEPHLATPPPQNAPVFPVTEHAGRALPLPLLHTALQRHRPKSA